MRPAARTAVGGGMVAALLLAALLGCRAPAATRPAATPAPTAAVPAPATPVPSSDGPSAVASSPSASLSSPAESSVPAVPEPEVVVGVDARVRTIPERQWRRIVSTGTWRPGCPAGRSDLRRIDLNYRTFDGAVERGQLVAHKDSADDLVEIFSALFEAGFPIERMQPVERFGGDVNRSLAANNTSAFNCRKPGQINAPVQDSPHANGRAIDINPVQNPWRDPRCTCWQPGLEFARSKDGPGVIREGSLPVRLFEERGW
ncbi:MAG: M15 family metallopeptidase, partial [Actinomycetota bacterium]|nr:M15 family metallopeptidase [Actinomycetota bacterium]